MRRLLAFALTALLIAACGDDGPSTPDDTGDPPELRASGTTTNAGSWVVLIVTGDDAPAVRSARLVPGDSVTGSPVEGSIRTNAAGDTLFVEADLPRDMAEGAWDLMLEVEDGDGTPTAVRLPKLVRVRPAAGGSPPAVTLRVRALVTGQDFDPAFTVVNETGCSGSACPRTSLPYGGRVEYQLPTGDYTIRLDDVAPNCTVAGPNPATIPVRSSTTAELLFRVTCTALPSPAIVRVGVSASGSDVDNAVRVACENDACIPRFLSPNGAPFEYRLPAGTYRFVLGEVAANCRLSGNNPVEVTVAAGATAAVDFALTCAGPTVIRVAVTTTGADLDDGYLVDLNASCPGYSYTNCATLRLTTNGSADYSTRASEPLAVLLRDVAVNCSVEGGALRQVTPTPGDTVLVAYVVTCRAAARVRISVEITGYQPTAAYQVVEGSDCYYGPCERYALTGTGGEFVVSEGPHALRLEGVDLYLCRLTSPGTAAVTAVSGTTVDAIYRLSCLPPAVARVSVTVSGTNPDASFVVQDDLNCDFYYGTGCPQRITSAGAALAYDLSYGSGQWTLLDVAPNCRITSANPLAVSNIPAGTSTDVRFTVACE